MNRKRILRASLAIVTLLVLVVFSYQYRATMWASQPKVSAGDENASLAGQIKELQKRVAELKAQAHEPRIVAAGTAKCTLPEVQDNRTKVRVKLAAEIAERLGDDYVVLLTERFPTGGYPYFSAYWKKAPLGFDITLVDTTLAWGTTASYANRNRTHFVDWIVVRKGS